MRKELNGYLFNTEAGHKTSSATFYSATKNGTRFFLKCFDDPKRPSDRVSDMVKARKNADCENFIRERIRVVNALKTCVGSTIVAPVEFFEAEHRFYQSTLWMDIKRRPLAEICAYDEPTKRFLLKNAAQTLKILHSRGIVHFDIKPDNLPVALAERSGRPVCTLIDFDSSYFEDSLPDPDLAAATFPYMSPELAAYKMRDDRFRGTVTVKSDVFALAIVFHEYWSGRKFIFNGSDSIENARFLYQAVDAGETVEMAPEIPVWLERLLRWMILREPEDRPTMQQVFDYLRNPVTYMSEDDRKREYVYRWAVERMREETADAYGDAVRAFEMIPGWKDAEELAAACQARLETLISPAPAESAPSGDGTDAPEETEKVVSDVPCEAPKDGAPAADVPDRSASGPGAGTGGYARGPAFPADANSFEVLPNGNIKIVYDGSKENIRADIALRRGYIVRI